MYIKKPDIHHCILSGRNKICFNAIIQIIFGTVCWYDNLHRSDTLPSSVVFLAFLELNTKVPMARRDLALWLVALYVASPARMPGWISAEH